MKPAVTDHPRAAWAATTLLGLSALVMWLPALRTPFWGDDYVFLLHAHAANLGGVPWWSEFWPRSPLPFWRPLSQEGYWRAMAATFGGSALAMHAASLTLHVLASISVGVLALCVARACRWRHAGRKAALAGVIYGALAMHMLPVHWAAAANNSMLTLWTALALAAWLVAADARGARRGALLVAAPVALALALLTKESAVLIPLLMVLLSLFAGHLRWSRGRAASLGACVVIVLVWLALDARFTADTDSAYTLELGVNVIRNAAAFLAWMLNVPREALRMGMVGNAWLALAWIAVTALPIVAVWGVALWRGHRRISPPQWLVVAAFAVLAYGPYFLFSWNSYAYYAAVAAILPVIVLAHLSANARRAWLVAVLVGASSWLAVAGSRHANQPALIARAQWGENLLQQLARDPVGTPLWVQVSNPRRFYAVGKAGLAWRLGIQPTAIHVAPKCPAMAPHCLIINAAGCWHWRRASATARTTSSGALPVQLRTSRSAAGSTPSSADGREPASSRR